MISSSIKRTGLWSAIFLAVLGLAYIALVAAMLASGSGLPPKEPFHTMVNVVVLLTAVGILILWNALHQATLAGKKFYSQTSLGLMEIFTAWTSLIRYITLTVVKQSLESGNLAGLQWFLPYGWPSTTLAMEFLAWGVFFGLACLAIVPVFTRGKLERSIFWMLNTTGGSSLLAASGQVIGFNTWMFNLFTFAGVMAWRPGLTGVVLLMAIWFHKTGSSLRRTYGYSIL